MKNLIDNVNAVLVRYALIPPGAPALVGVSGGADSVALLHMLHRLDIPVVAVHLNHSIRGAEADADQQFVQQLCAQLNVMCVAEKVDVPARARAAGRSLEMAARDARHALFRSALTHCAPGAVVALAHHADDQLETFFLRAARGTSGAGLGGMRRWQAMRGFHICRPLLDFRKRDVVQWLAREKLVWREDASNASEAIPRNCIRHQIVPHLERINERAAQNILRTMATLRASDQELRERTSARDQLIAWGVAPSCAAIERWIDFSKKSAGTHWIDFEGVRLVNEYGTVRRAAPAPPPPRVTIRAGVGILRGRWRASISARTVAGRAVRTRTVQPGDRMAPYGMAGSKKLQDIFTDLKIPRVQRADWPVVVCGGEIVWVPGYRIARGWELHRASEPALHLLCER